MVAYQKRETPEPAVEPLEESEIEIEGEDEGDISFMVGPDGEPVPIEDSGIEEDGPGDDSDWNANLAEFIDEDELTALSNNLVELYEADKRSRQEWWDTYVKGLDLLGLKIEERSMPWRDACGVFHPLLAESLIRYVSEAALELFPPAGPAQMKIIGPETTETRKQAVRMKTELNYQLTKKMPGNRDDLEMTLWRQALAGACFRKGYKDPVTKRPVLKMVPADNLIAQYGTVSLHTCGRYTHEMPGTPKNDVMKKMAVGFYRALDLGDTAIGINDEVREKEDELQGQSKSYETDDEDMTILEMYVDVDLPGYEHTNKNKNTGIKLPYIITIDKDSGKVLSIYRNHDEDNPFVKRRVYFSHYKYMAGFGLYGFGLIHILGGLTDGATSILRQLVDAGVLNNLPAGFKSRSLRIKGDDTPLRPGELRDVDLPPGMLEKSISWIPTKEPSIVLAQLLQSLVDEGRRVGSISDMKIGEAGGANAPVGTTLAMIEVHRKVISAVGARNYASMETELEMVTDILANDMPPEYDYPIEGGPFNRQEDFSSRVVTIYPVADPSGSTASLRIMRYNAVEQLSERQPHLYDMAYLHRQMVETYEIPNADKIIPLADEFVPLDPVAENMNIMQMRPVKAFMNQDHEAHITTHMASMQDPIIQQLIGQSPNAAAIQAAAMAHIQEHVAYAYRDKMQQALGITLPEPGTPLPAEQEAALSRAIAEAAQQVLGRSQQQVAAQAAQQAQQDPMLQLRIQEVEIKKKEAEVKLLAAQIKAATDAEKTKLLARKEELEAMIAMEELAIEKERLKIDAKKADAEVMNKKESLESNERMESIRMTVDTLNKAQDRDERRESTKEANEIKKRDSVAKARSRTKPSNK